MTVNSDDILLWKLRLETYWHDALWRIETNKLPLLKAEGVRGLRVLYIVIHGFRGQQVNLLGAALTFTSLMSLVPLLALSLSVLKGLGIGKALLQQADGYLADMPLQFQEFTNRLIDLVTKTDFAQLGGIGGLVLLTMVIQMLSRIETAFNQIWAVREQRSWSRKITNYISVIVVVPILLVAAITVTAQYKFGDTLATLGLLRVVPFLFTWAAFAFLYQCLPNIRVQFKASVLGGLAGALLWQSWLRVYIWVQPGVTNYNVIYGTLASVPIFLAWLYISWQIVLLGALVSQAIQTEAHFVRERRQSPTGPRLHLMAAWAMLIHAGKALLGEEETLSLHTLAKNTNLDQPFLRGVADNLVDLDLLAPTGEPGEHYLLKRHPQHIQIDAVSKALLSVHNTNLAGAPPPFDASVKTLNNQLDAALTNSDLHQSLADICAQGPPPKSDGSDAVSNPEAGDKGE
ncbi:YihY/virulence factor BrkB family protein [Acanthopleuribacter pedis]|uniref:YihY/virulence factor BrkB family protein n=1 Tax=Acanthopleuribacter pedis TaxID=442870 RepID=A0A8J7Q983_9BACT|nr:YihY/virulence factor BrkB family protein [Acanthopleuribacter pedis]MBO1320941.1 YihY/virulence factor BrkB family protein [Acanthopleuribacter pedis]